MSLPKRGIYSHRDSEENPVASDKTMPAFCKRCGLHIPDGISACRMCGSTVLAAPPPPDLAGPIYSGKSLPQDRPKLSRWLIVVAIGLVVIPILRVGGIITVHFPLLYTDQGRAFLDQHPGLEGLISFQMYANVLLALLALGLNYLFYAKSKHFTRYMIVYTIAGFLYQLTVTAILRFGFPDADMSRNFVPLVRSMIWSGGLTIYLLTAPEVKARFSR